MRIIMDTTADGDAEVMARIAVRFAREHPGDFRDTPSVWTVTTQAGSVTYYTRWTKGGAVKVGRTG